MELVLLALVVLPVLAHLGLNAWIRKLVTREPKVAWLRKLPLAGTLAVVVGVPIAMGIWLVMRFAAVAGATGAEQATALATGISEGLNCGTYALLAANLVYLAGALVVAVVAWRLPPPGRPDAF